MTPPRKRGARPPLFGKARSEIYRPNLSGAELITVIRALDQRADDYEKSAASLAPAPAFKVLREHDLDEARLCRTLADRLQAMRIKRSDR
ncbi:MAG: hypothetical protein ACLQJR_05790 [Stellaceae bacterium]